MPPSADEVTPSATPVIATATPIPPTATATPRPVLNSVTVSLPGVLDTLNPLLSRSPLARSVASLIFPSLVTATSDGRFAGSLATTWAAANLSWTFHLDTTRHWQDGTPVTATDVTYTIGQIQATSAVVDPQLHVAWQGIQVTTPDSETVTLTAPASIGASILDLATTPILPAHLLAATPVADLQLVPFVSHPVGSGPYQVVSADSTGAILVASGHNDLQPRRLVVETASNSAEAPGHVAPGTGIVKLLNAVSTASGMQVSAFPLARPVYVFLNSRDSLLSNVAVRQALSLATNRPQLVAGPLRGGAVALRSPLMPGIWQAESTALTADEDNAEAEHVLDVAGWASQAGSTRRREGQDLAITLLVDDDPGRLAVAQDIAVQWRAIGIQVTVEAVGLEGLLRDFLLPGHYQAALIGTQQRGVEPDLAELWHTGGALNISGWSDPVADAALEATRASDLESQRAGYRAFAQRFADEMPAIPLYLPVARFAVQGLRLPASVLNDPSDVLRAAASWRPFP